MYLVFSFAGRLFSRCTPFLGKLHFFLSCFLSIPVRTQAYYLGFPFAGRLFLSCWRHFGIKGGNGPGDIWGTAVRNKDEELKTFWESIVLRVYRMGDYTREL